VRLYQRCGELNHSCARRIIRRSVRGLYTTLIIVGTFIVCWMPYCLFVCIITALLYIDSDAMVNTVSLYRLFNYLDFYLYDLILLNCVIDPFIYAVRMREVQTGYRRVTDCLLGRRDACESATAHGHDVSQARWSVEQPEAGRRRTSSKSRTNSASGGQWPSERRVATSDRGSMSLVPPTIGDPRSSINISTSRGSESEIVVEIRLKRITRHE